MNTVNSTHFTHCFLNYYLIEKYAYLDAALHWIQGKLVQEVTGIRTHDLFELQEQNCSETFLNLLMITGHPAIHFAEKQWTSSTLLLQSTVCVEGPFMALV